MIINNLIKKTEFNLIFFINLFFCLFPLSFILGNLILNLNLLIVCILGIFYLRKKIFNFKPNIFFSIIILFFFSILFSTVINLESFELNHLKENGISNFLKSIFFLRFLILLILIYLLSQYEAINFRYFFYSSTFFVMALALDVIYQYFVGHDIFGLEGSGRRNPGFFGKDEPIAGGFLQRFSFFSIFLIYLISKNQKLKNFFLTSLGIYILLIGILLAGDRMPATLFLFGLLITFIFISFFRKPILLAFSIFLITFTIVINANVGMKKNYLSFYVFSKDILLKIYGGISNNKKFSEQLNGDSKNNSKDFLDKIIGSQLQYMPRINNHTSLFLTAIDTWRMNKIFGNGIKSFREDCKLMIKSRFKYRNDYHKLIRRHRSCSNHPHNYYLEILTETGIVGFVLFISIALIILFLSIKFLVKYRNQLNEKNLILFASIMGIMLELFPIKSSGSFFTTQNATYLTIMIGIIVSYKNLNTAR